MSKQQRAAVQATAYALFLVLVGALASTAGSNILEGYDRVLLADGTAASPSFALSSDDDGSGTGWFRGAANRMDWSSDGTVRLQVGSSITVQNAGMYISGRTGLIGFSGGQLYGHRRRVEANTAVAASPHALTIYGDDSYVFTNEGATAENHVDLVTASSGETYTFVVQDADGMQINAASGDTIRIGGTVSASGGFVSSTTIGDYLILVCINANEWVALSPVMGWTFDT